MSKLTYIRCGDYDIPNLKLSEQPETSIGKYGRMRKSYLKEHRPILYNQLLMSEELYPHLLEIDRTAQERMDTMLPHMMETAGVTEELKACDPMRWVGLMNTLTAQIEEILIRENLQPCSKSSLVFLRWNTGGQRIWKTDKNKAGICHLSAKSRPFLCLKSHAEINS